jgi:hypothetical protein
MAVNKQIMIWFDLLCFNEIQLCWKRGGQLGKGGPDVECLWSKCCHMPWYGHDIAESGVKHNKSNQIIICLFTAIPLDQYTSIKPVLRDHLSYVTLIFIFLHSAFHIN